MSPLNRTLIGVVVMFILMAFANRMISKKLVERDQELYPMKTAPQQTQTESPDQESPKQKIRHKLVPEDPAKYGMIVQSKAEQPTSEKGWETYLREVFEEKKLFDSEEAKEVLKEAYSTEDEYKDYMTKLEEHIDMYKEKQRQDPLNVEVEQQLQQMYQLKAVGKILKNKVVTDLDSSGLPESLKVKAPELQTLEETP